MRPPLQPSARRRHNASTPLSRRQLQPRHVMPLGKWAIPTKRFDNKSPGVEHSLRSGARRKGKTRLPHLTFLVFRPRAHQYRLPKHLHRRHSLLPATMPLWALR